MLKILLTLFFTGYGFTALFLPEKLKKDSFFIVFWIGIVLSIIYNVGLTTARIPIDQGRYVVLFFSLIFFIYSVIKKKSLKTFSRETSVMAILVLACILVTASKNNLIQNSDINDSKYLISHSLTEDITRLSFKPYLEVDSKFPTFGFMLGNPLLLGFISNTTGVDPESTYGILKAILFSITLPLIYILIKNLFKKINKNLLIVIYLIMVSISIRTYMLSNDFYSQILFLGILTYVSIIFQNYFSELKNMTGFFNSHDLLMAIGISSMSSIYPKGLIITCILLTIYLASKVFTKERKLLFWTLAKILLLAIIINPMTFGLAVRFGY